MTHYLFDKVDKIYTISNSDHLNMEIIDNLEPDVYSVQYSETLGYFLTKNSPFSLPEKRYGENKEIANKIYLTFKDRKGATAILASGEKGSGKTLLAKTLSLMAKQDGIPTLIVNAPLFGTNFNNFIQKIEQTCVIFFDEFEKIYHDQKWQENLLSLLDGVFNSKKLFLFTVNNTWNLTEFLINRPTRVFYHIHYESLSEKFIREYCVDRLDDQSKINDIVLLATFIKRFNFDMLQSLVEEMNRYKESVKNALKYLNINLENDALQYKVIDMFRGQKRIQIKDESKKIYLSLIGEDAADAIIYYNEYESDFSESMFDMKISKKENKDEDDNGYGSDFHINENDDDYDIKNKLARAERAGLKVNKLIKSNYTKFDKDDIIKSENNNRLLTLKNDKDFTIIIEQMEKRTVNFKQMFF